MRLRRRGDRRERGLVMVEFALMVPVLVMFVFGIVDLGRAYSLRNRLINAAREGGGFAQNFPQRVDSTCDPTNSFADIIDKTIHEDTSLGLAPPPSSDVTVARTPAGSSTATAYTGCSQTFGAGDTVTVTTHKQFTVLTPLVSWIVGGTITLKGTDQVAVQCPAQGGPPCS